MTTELTAREAPARYVVEVQPAIPTGYKQTEVGVIPEDWEMLPLGKLLEGMPTYGINAPAISYDSRYPTYLRITDISEDGRFLDASKASVNHSLTSGYMLSEGDLVFARTGASVGKSYLYDRRDGELVFAGFLIRVRPDTKKLEPRYLKYFAQSKPYWNWVKVNSMRSGQPGINGREYASVLISLPPSKAEQEAIAEALSDADALIEALEQLIAKKRQLKQGAMQELLTGKKRLPGFSGEKLRNSEIGEMPCDWQVIEIGKVASVKTGPFGSSLHERDYVDDGTPIITVEHLGERGVEHNNLPMVSDVDRKRLNAYSLEEGDIVFSRVGSVDRNARISNREHGWLFSGRLLRLRCMEEGVDTRFLSYQFHFEPFKQRVRTVAVGQTMASLNTQILKGVMIALPSPEEQTAIATILSDMDAEIAALETRLAKARGIKQGMMQELLTGRIRLV